LMGQSSRQLPSSPRTQSGKRPTAASLQRQREYAVWLQAQPQAGDASWATFMAERRVQKERVGLQQIGVKQRRERFRRRHGASPPPEAEQRQALELEFQAYRDARLKAAEAQGRRWLAHEPSLRMLFEAERRKQKERARLRKISDKRRVARHAAKLEQREAIDRQRLEKTAAEAASRQQARDAAAARRAERRAASRAARQWSTEGQCEGMTRASGGLVRCRVHRSSPYAVAAPLRRGERFCGHHHPDKYTGVRCAGIRKGGKGQCRVWSGCCYADAAPLRRGSPYCQHHRVRCVGLTRSGARCTVTSSSEHEHAQPLREGATHCAHHQPVQPPAPPAASAQEASPPPAAAAPTTPITLAIGSTFEAEAGALPPSIFIAAKSAFLEDYIGRIQARFPELQYTALVLAGVQKSAWVLPLAAQTAETGTLALFMSGLGLSVEEVDMDAESEADSDVDSARCDTEDDELPPGVYRDADGTVLDLDDGSFGGSWDS